MSALEDQPEALADEDEEEEDEDDEEVVVAAPPAQPDPEASLEEVLAKREKSSDEDDADEESMLAAEPDERLGALPAKVAPQQETEFVCKNCFLVKHRSQLADKRRMFCKDCA